MHAAQQTSDDRLLTRSDAARLGIGPSTLSGPAFRRIFRGVYVSSAQPDSVELRTSAALRLAPADAFVSHHTAAELWGAVVPRQSQIHLSIESTSRWAGPEGITVHARAPLPRKSAHLGFVLTTAETTFRDLAAHLDLVDLVALGDSLVYAKRTSPQRLIRIADDSSGSGSRLARRAARLVRKGVESAPESRLRMLIVLAGLPEPTVNFIMYHADGSWRYRCDLAWEDFKTAVEYDGRQHAQDDRQWASDIARREDFDNDGWRLVVVRSPDLYQSPANTLERILRVLEQQGGRRPRQLRPEWRRHFPGHLPVSG